MSIEPGATKETRRVLITGCARSGTKYVAHLLTQMGLDVGHEKMGRDGISSWCMATPAQTTPWGPGLDGTVDFKCVLHQVRHPALVIPSLSTIAESSWQFICEHSPCSMDEPLLLRSAKYWVHWNRKAGEIAEWRYAVERLPEHFDEFCRRIGVPADRKALRAVAPNVNTRAYTGINKLLAWAALKVTDEPPAFIRTRLDRRAYAKSTDTEGGFSYAALRDLDKTTHDELKSLLAEYGYGETPPAGGGGA